MRSACCHCFLHGFEYGHAIVEIHRRRSASKAASSRTEPVTPMRATGRRFCFFSKPCCRQTTERGKKLHNKSQTDYNAGYNRNVLHQRFPTFVCSRALVPFFSPKAADANCPTLREAYRKYYKMNISVYTTLLRFYQRCNLIDQK